MRSMTVRRTRSLVVTLGALLLTGAVGACSELLDVTNPSAITEDNLKGDDQTVEFMVNGIQGEFRREYAWMAAHSAVFTDEAIQGHPWSPWNAYDARNITPDSPAYDGLSYQLLQRARGTADELIAKIETALGDRASNSVGLAKAYAYAGYAYLLVADFLCEAPINISAPKSQAELYGMAAERFEQAITIATAAGTAAGASDALMVARVGLARTALNLNDKPGAISAATGVPATFSAWVRYSADAGDWQVYNFMNWFAGYRFAGELDLALDPAQFGSFSDQRVPFDPVPRRLGNGVRDGLLPYQTPSFSEWAPGRQEMFKETTAIRFASGLEAQYIIAEAGGMSAAALRTFIDQRRAIGGLGAFAGSDTELFRELLDQRYRDFFLDGHRMGDLRRYKRLYQLDFWPKGQMPGLQQQYGTQECWPIAASEKNSNPNIP
jgi:hypothetical protein